MPYNGSGVFSTYTPGTPYVTGTVISSTVANNVNSDVATGLSNCVLKDGTQTATAAVPFAQGINVTSATGTFYYKSTYTATATGMTTAPTGTVNYTITGNAVVLALPQISGTSNANTFTLTGAPAAIRPVSNNKNGFVVRITDNGGAIAFGIASMNTSGVLSLFVNAAGGSWTGAGTKSIEISTVTYTLD